MSDINNYNEELPMFTGAFVLSPTVPTISQPIYDYANLYQPNYHLNDYYGMNTICPTCYSFVGYIGTCYDCFDRLYTLSIVRKSLRNYVRRWLKLRRRRSVSQLVSSKMETNDPGICSLIISFV